MEVTKQNFSEVFSSLPSVFKRAQFIALDTEFTGLKVQGAPILTNFDTLQELYVIDSLKAKTFLAIQFGIVAFFYDKETDKYTHQGYNFYIYPSSKANFTFACGSNTIKFLVEHGFDFNKLFLNGIPFVREKDGQNLLKKLKEKYDKMSQPESHPKVEISGNKQVIVEIKNKIKDILNSGKTSEFTIEKYNSFIRRLIYTSVRVEFAESVFIETNKDETMTVIVSCSPEEMKKIREEKYLLEKKELLDEIGFSKVIKLIIESKKLLVGHNILLDLLFTINQCLEPLPDTYDEFKSLVKFLFPKFLDTKYMVSSVEFKNMKDTALPTLVEYFRNLNMIPEVGVEEYGKGFNIDDNKLHEAGFDAYLTGLCAITMAKHLGTLNCDSNILKVLPDSPLLQPFLNKIAIQKKLNDINFMNIGGFDVEPDRDGVYYLTFPKEWTRENINELFKNYGFVSMAWINDTSAYVRIKKEFMKEVESNLMNNNSNYNLCTFKDFQNSNRNPNHSKSTLAENNKFINKIEENSQNNSEPFKLLSDSQNKRQNEDIGEAIERPSKKHFSL